MSEIARQLISAARDAMLARDYERALYLCNQAIEADPDLPDAHAVKADWLEVYLLDGICRAHDASAAGDKAQARSICEELLEHAPDNIDILHSLALFQDALEESYEGYERVLRLEPRTTNDFRCQANALDSLRRYDEADAAWTRAIELSSDDIELHTLRAETRLNAHKPSEAKAILDEVLRQCPGNAEAFALQARAALYLGYFEDALRYAAQARQAGFEMFWLEGVEAEALYFLDRYAEAEVKFRQLAEHENYLDTNELLTYGCTLAELKKPQEAIEVFESRVELEDRDGGWHAALAGPLFQLGMLEEGLRHLAEAFRLAEKEYQPDDPWTVYCLAWTHAYRAKLTEGFQLPGFNVEADLDKAVELLPRAVSMDETCHRYARAAVELAPIWARLDM